MSGSSRDNPRKRPSRKKRARSPLIASPSDRQALRRRVGAFIRQRREEIGLSQGDICRALSYRSLNSVSNLETGREGLPAKRIYAWADILQLPRDAFFRFVTGETERMDASGEGDRRGVRALTTAEKELLETYRGLPPRYQQRLREQAHEFETLARAGSAKRRPKR